jgi:hypothetical protein
VPAVVQAAYYLVHQFLHLELLTQLRLVLVAQVLLVQQVWLVHHHILDHLLVLQVAVAAVTQAPDKAVDQAAEAVLVRCLEQHL